ncbi:iron donor protein CyaY [Exophiala spinifera]|uniref:ferroxidase n=1 Tax=Exophiala spinifera TaxID=91928 RepID=A0A0D2C3K7_9EURO|nr:iron donor protein CyaY [Exophiala spinifera]KIW18224.1 iron donor protein CyaY [Exophiala spinifera]
MKATSLFRTARAAAATITRSTPTRPSSSLLPSLRRNATSASTPLALRPSALLNPRLLRSCDGPRTFSTSRVSYKGILPESSEPQPPNTDSSPGSSPAQITDAEYHEIADQYLDTLVLALEELSESRTDGLEVEFSAGVLTVTHPQAGTYVINKQPPNKQIWLSSPVSGPKRYDWVVSGAGQHEKEGSEVDAGDDGAGGRWVYLRDNSQLSDLLKKELGVEVTKEDEADAIGGREGPAGQGSSIA